MRDRLLRTVLTLVCVSAAGLSAACGGSSNNNSTTTTPPPTGSNVQSLSVDDGPIGNYPNAAFTSVTVCVPGTSTCSTIDGVLVDTGSVGLRLLASAAPSLSLPELTGSNGTTYYNCVNFVDNSYLWGPVAQADIEIAGEKASSASIQWIEDPTGFSVPSGCANGGADDDNIQALGANGILGVGSFPQDCGVCCANSNSCNNNGAAVPDIYFTCESTGNCATNYLAVAQQVENPVIGFPTDNNGVLIQMESVNGEAATSTGSLVFGISTETNNQLGSTAVYTLNDVGFFTTNFNGQAMSSSFIDSGSNGLYFPDASIPICTDNSPFYCPSGSLNLSAQNVGANNTQGGVNFTVANADGLDYSDAALADLAGSNGSNNCGTGTACGFDWGLPFFYGRNVFVSIEGQSVPSGAPAAPWWAY